MTSRIRVSAARPNASRLSAAPTPSRNNASNVDLPAYRKPSHPLDQEATRALLELRGRYQNDIKKHNAQATKNITGTVEGVNDMLRDHAQYMERKQKKWNAGKSLDDKEEEERYMKELQAKVDETTVKLEESMRAVIDSGVAAQRIDETLEWLRSNAPRRLEAEYQTQIMQRDTQRETQRQSQANEESQMDGLTPGPTPLDGFRPALTGASEMFTIRIQSEKDQYTSLSLTARYARNNDYRDFKRIVHDAKYGDDGPALGHEDTWFTETGSPAPGITDSTQRGDFDDDDDIIVDKATISTRCPITYQQFKEPVTSTKCPHTFEKNAILEMIRSGPHRIGGEKAVECPVAACNQMITRLEVRADPLLIRKIRRMQQAEAAAAEDSSDDEVQAPRRDMQQLDGRDDEPESSRLQVPATQQLTQSSIIEDLGDPSDSEMSG